MKNKISVEEKEWMSRSDARTLSEAEVIKADKQRLKNAQQAAKKMAEDKMTEANAMNVLATAKPLQLSQINKKAGQLKKNIGNNNTVQKKNGSKLFPF